MLISQKKREFLKRSCERMRKLRKYIMPSFYSIVQLLQHIYIVIQS